MVVTRRQNAGPLPAVTSRTNSSSGSSRSKGKGVDKTSSPEEPGTSPTRSIPNGTSPKTPMLTPGVPEDVSIESRDVAPKQPPPKPSTPVPKPKTKSKKSTKTKKPHLNKGISIFDMLARLFLVWFTIYSLYVCPDDVDLRSPVCRALTDYRRIVLEPFVYPPVRAALEHPSIAPHIQRVQPYYNRAVQTTKPWVRRGKYEWRTQVVPRLQWLQLRARPYVRQMQRQYDATLGPYVRQATDVIAQYKAKADPYILSVSLKTQKTWKRARPFVRPVLRGASHVPGILVRLIGRPLGDARRQWVDPQVAKIWAAVVEKGQPDTTNVKTRSPTTTVPNSSPAPSPTTMLFSPSSSTPTSTLPLEDVPASSSDVVSISSLQDEAAASASSTVMDSALPTSPSMSMASTISANDVSESSPEGSPLVDATDDAAISPSSVVQESLLQSSESPVATPSTSLQISPEPTSTNVESPHSEEEEAVEDLEQFLAEIGINDDPVPEPTPDPSPDHGFDTPPEQPPPVQEEETEEEKEERLRLKAIETAEQRADIERRHTQWEIDLQNFGKAQRKVVRAALNKMREAAVEEARAPGATIRMHVDGLLQEAEKSLKSLKAYTRKLVTESKPEAEKIKTWENVVKKVDKKFDDRVEAAADAIREWWSSYVDKEIGQVKAIGDEVNALAHRAQSDIGMDYAWLSDVTYEDWQRYHKLIATSDKFADLYISMQNGTHKSAPPNPLIDVMEALQEEVDDMVLGFEANLTRVKNEGLNVISGTEAKKVTSTPAAGGSVPEVSILPIIDPITAEIKDGEIPPVILSRGAEEIKAAMSRAEEAKTQAAHGEL